MDHRDESTFIEEPKEQPQHACNHTPTAMRFACGGFLGMTSVFVIFLVNSHRSDGKDTWQWYAVYMFILCILVTYILVP